MVKHLKLHGILKRMLSNASSSEDDGSKGLFNPDDQNEGMASHSALAAVSSDNSALTCCYPTLSDGSLFSSADSACERAQTTHHSRRQNTSLSPFPSPLSTSSTSPSSTSSTPGTKTLATATTTTTVPYTTKTVILNNKKLMITMAMLDKVVYLNAKNLRPVSLRGNLILTVKKPMRIREIDLRLEGYVLVYFFYRSDMLIQSGRVQKRQFLSQTRSWPYPKAGPSGEPGSISNCMDTDMFSKGNYKFPFQFVVNSKLPESLANVFGSIYYSLRVMIKIPMRYPRRDKTETAIMPIEFVQCSSDPVRRHSRASASSEFVSTANWRNLLYYRVTISHRPPLAIGDTFDISIKVLPIIRERYKIRAIRVSLVQTIEYNVDCRDEEFFSDLVQTEKIPLQTINIRDLQDPNVCKPYVKKMEIPLERIYTRGNDEDRFIVCPTTNSIENSMCHFKVSHQIRVGIVVQEICPHNQGTTCFELGKNSVPLVDPEMPELVDHPRMSKGTSSQAAQDKDDNDFIISTAKMVEEGDDIEDLRYKTVELLVTGNIQILRPESTDGNMPPPTYSDSASTGVCTQFEKVHIGDVDNVSVTIPPAYEETMELLPQQIMPPAYS